MNFESHLYLKLFLTIIVTMHDKNTDHLVIKVYNWCTHKNDVFL